jgi:ATP-dependent Clp protease ATP-binding subunit ClpA
VTLTLTAEARGWLADRGFDPKMGARPMARIIQAEVKRPLAEKILFGELLGGGSVQVEVEEDGTKLRLVATPAATPPKPAAVTT